MEVKKGRERALNIKKKLDENRSQKNNHYHILETENIHRPKGVRKRDRGADNWTAFLGYSISMTGVVRQDLIRKGMRKGKGEQAPFKIRDKDGRIYPRYDSLRTIEGKALSMKRGGGRSLIAQAGREISPQTSSRPERHREKPRDSEKKPSVLKQRGN